MEIVRTKDENIDHPLLEEVPGLRFPVIICRTIERSIPGSDETETVNILDPRTIYGQIRMLNFQINASMEITKTGTYDLDRILTNANIRAVKGTWKSFMHQFVPRKPLDIMSESEVEQMFKDAKEKNK